MDQRFGIGLDRRLELDWLEAAAELASAGCSPADARSQLWLRLEGALAGDTPQSARGKTLTVLSRIWLTPPTNLRWLRNQALGILAENPGSRRLAPHWAMMLAAYPFFATLAGTVGGLLAIEDRVPLALVTRRLKERLGDRSSVPRATQRALRTLVSWNVLRETGDKGVYQRAEKPATISPTASHLLIAALVTTSEQNFLAIDYAADHPALFPFRIALTPHELRTAPNLDVNRQGLDLDVVRLRPSAGALC